MNISNQTRHICARALKLLQGVCVYIFQFVIRKRDFFDCIIVGAVLAVLCLPIPFLGRPVGTIVLIISGFIGLIRELRNALSGPPGPRDPPYFEQY